MKKTTQTIYERLLTSSVFTGVLEKPLFQRFFEYEESEGSKKLRAYGKFVAEIYALGGSLTEGVKRLLSEDENSLDEIAQRCGFSDGYSMSKFFKKHEGLPPGKYRKSLYE